MVDKLLSLLLVINELGPDTQIFSEFQVQKNPELTVVYYIGVLVLLKCSGPVKKI